MNKLCSCLRVARLPRLVLPPACSPESIQRLPDAVTSKCSCQNRQISGRGGACWSSSNGKSSTAAPDGGTESAEGTQGQAEKTLPKKKFPQVLGSYNPLSVDAEKMSSAAIKTGYYDEPEVANVADVMFQIFRSPSTNKVSMSHFLKALRETGLRNCDPRLQETMENLQTLAAQCGVDVSLKEAMDLDQEQFKSVIKSNIVLLSRAFRHQFRIPDFQSFCSQIEEIYWKCKDIDIGKVASYIPQLSRYSRHFWGVSVCTVDGQRFSIGDVDIPFTLQSCTKPLNYGLALDELGGEEVHRFVGQEPSGRMFNAILLDHNRKPHNPMINAGAIIVCALLQGVFNPKMPPGEKFEHVQNFFRHAAGMEHVGFNNSVFLSERDAADRNYALGYFMKEHHCFPSNVDLKDCLDFYFQCCSLEADCESVSVMAGTLANGGICPTTGEKVSDAELARIVFECCDGGLLAGAANRRLVIS